jgi:outer membrane protein
MEKAYQAEKILLTEEMKRNREAEIEQKRKEARELQKKRFGVEGDLFKKREELVKPIQDEIYAAIQEVASQGQLMVVFDKASNSNILYSNPKHDISDKVLKKMGLKPGDTNDGGEGEEEDEKKPGEKPEGKSGSNTGKGGTGKSSPKRNP